MRAAFTIGQLSRLSGVPVRALRLYDRLGLVLPAGRTDAGYRLYPKEALDRLHFIKQAQVLGLRLTAKETLLVVRPERPGRFFTATQADSSPRKRRWTPVRRFRLEGGTVTGKAGARGAGDEVCVLFRRRGDHGPALVRAEPGRR